MTPSCLVIGAVNADLLATTTRFCAGDEAAALTGLVTAPGGHAANCAVALARLGSPVTLLGAVGRDQHGAMVRGAMVEAGVDVSCLQTVADAPTGIAFVFVLPTGERSMYLMHGANERLSEHGLADAVDAASPIIVFNPPEEIGAEIGRLNPDNPIVFAPGGIAAREVEQADPAFLEVVDYLVVNAPESRELTGAVGPADAAVALATRWELCATVTDGARGCWTAQGGLVEHCAAFAVATTDSTGAGDAFVAGFVHSLGRGEEVPAATRFGCAVGALATRQIGAQASLPFAEEIEPLLREHATLH